MLLRREASSDAAAQGWWDDAATWIAPAGERKLVPGGGGFLPAVAGAAIAAGAGYAFGYERYVNELSRQMRQTYGLSREQGNAFGHVFASAHLAARFGPHIAKAGGDLREILFSRRPASNYQDLYNNEIGRQIANYLGSDWSIEKIRNLALDAVFAGDAIAGTSDSRIPGSFSGRPRDFTVRDAVWRRGNTPEY